MTAFVGGAVVLMAPAAEAGYTAVKQSKRRNEVSHEQILERVYGGNFAADATGLSFSNESGVTVTRLADDGAEASLSGTKVSARAVAAFSRNRKTAGYFGASSGGQVQRLFEASGRGFGVSGAGEASTGLAGDLTFGKGRRGRTFSSVASANRDRADHLVSYEVKGLSGQQASVYLLCWEDKFARRSDSDFNDLVVEVHAGEAMARGAMAEPLLIPLPPAAWTGLSGLLGLGLAAAARRRRNVLPLN